MQVWMSQLKLLDIRYAQGKTINGAYLDVLVITTILIGHLNHRLFDKSQTKQYEILTYEYKCTPTEINSIIYPPNPLPSPPSM